MTVLSKLRDGSAEPKYKQIAIWTTTENKVGAMVDRFGLNSTKVSIYDFAIDALIERLEREEASEGEGDNDEYETS